MVQRLALGYAFEGKDCNEAVPLTWPITVAAHPEFSTLHSHLSTLQGLEGKTHHAQGTVKEAFMSHPLGGLHLLRLLRIPEPETTYSLISPSCFCHRGPTDSSYSILWIL